MPERPASTLLWDRARGWGISYQPPAPDSFSHALLEAEIRKPLSFTCKVDDADLPGLRQFIQDVHLDTCALDRWAGEGGNRGCGWHTGSAANTAKGLTGR